MGDTKTTLTWLLKDQVSGPAGKIGSELDKTGAAAGKSGGLMGKLSSATGGLVTPFSLVAAGATALFGGLVAAGKAAADEEKNVAKMTAALKASVPGFDGNTDSIEALIKKREDLAFSDDELRDSLATLVTSTHDVGQAQDLQATAMDLARLKGISLAEASEALAKANAGSTKELKALGITVDDSKDKTQVFAAIQKAAAGQAEAYAKTTNAKWETLQNKFGDLVETVGSAVLPIFNALADFALTTLIPAIEDFAAVFTDVAKQVNKAIAALHEFFKVGEYGKTKFYFGENVITSGKHATGGMLDPGWNLVGEEGPELISPGGQVYTAQQTRSMTGGGGSPVVIALHMDGREVARVVDEHLYYAMRGSGPSGWRA